MHSNIDSASEEAIIQADCAGSLTPLLDGINAPCDLKSLTLNDLEKLAAEVRHEIIKIVSINGGHLASPLGAVELTLAIHHVFDCATDQIVWDVGHQCYAHKLVTERRDRFHTLRTKGGLSGYPSPAESKYDAFGVGHSSTSISAALGMAISRDKLGLDHKVIAFIGDGAMTGGMAFEALSHAGQVNTDLLVILNDNEMSISHNVGALSAYFSRIITAGIYKRATSDTKSFVKKMIGKRLSLTAHRLEQSLKGFLVPGALFQELGFNYVGPVDGHDFPTLIECLSNIKKMSGPILFHCVTQKGKGCSFAENDPQKYHGVNPQQISVVELEGEARPSQRELAKPKPKSFTGVFSDVLIEEAQKDERIVAITAAMPTGTGLTEFNERFPDRCFDVGICEQHAVTFAAGLAIRNMRPVCAIYSTFFQRGYDQFIHDVCLQNLPVVFVLDRAGLVGQDSPTHAGAFDLSMLRAIPKVKIIAPRDDVDLALALKWALQQDSPTVIRYPKTDAETIKGVVGKRDISRGEILRQGSDLSFLGIGPLLSECLRAAEMLEDDGLSVGVADARFVKPLDTSLLDNISSAPIVTVEENALSGGFGSAVMEYFEEQERLSQVEMLRIGLPDHFIDHASRSEQLEELGLNATGLVKSVQAFAAKRLSGVKE